MKLEFLTITAKRKQEKCASDKLEIFYCFYFTLCGC